MALSIETIILNFSLYSYKFELLVSTHLSYDKTKIIILFKDLGNTQIGVKQMALMITIMMTVIKYLFSKLLKL